MAVAEVLRIERTYAAPPDAVFDAWTSEAVLRRWFHCGPYAETSEATVDLRVGGAVRVAMRDPDGGREQGGGGRYTEVDRPRRLAFTWTWDGQDREMLIEIDFEESDGATTVRFVHSNLRDAESVASHERGWNECFDHLERALEPAGRSAP